MKHTPFGADIRASLLACASLCAISTGHAANGSWSGLTSPGLWNNTANWTGAVVADGAGNTGNFSTVDLPAGLFTVSLDTPRTLGSLTFGDTDTSTAGSWLIDNNAVPTNILTLSGSPVVTVNALGTGAQAEISAVLAGTESISKAGAGALALSGVNTYTGGTTLNAGTLALNNAAALGTGALTINGGALGNTSLAAVTLSSNPNQTWAGDFAFTGPQNLVLGTGNVSVPAARIVNVSAGILEVSGIITSAAAFTKDGAGELRLHGDNLATSTGPLTLKGGTLRIRGNVPTGGTGAVINQNPLGAAARTITFEGGALMANGHQGSNGPTVGAITQPFTIAAGQTGTYYHAQRGSITSTISGAGTFNFVTNYVRGDINGNWAGFTGTLNISAATAGNSDFRIAGGTTFNAAMRVNISNASVSQTYNPPNNTVGTTHIIGTLTGTSAAFMGGSTVNGRFVNWQVGALNEDSEYAGVIANSTGAARLYKVGTGTLTLSGTNTYTGDTQLNAGKIQVGTGGATGSLAATNVITTAGTQLIFNRDNTAISAYPGILSGPGTITKKGTGQINFSGVNTYTAGTVIEGGIIGVNSASSLGAAAGAVSFTTGDGGIIAIAPGIVDAHPFSVASGITTSFGAATAADSLEVTSGITGAGSLAVTGSGVLTLSGANAYGGTTTIATGSLVATNVTGSATSTGAVALSGGTLAGTGTISGAVAATNNSSIKPGALTPTSSGVGNLTVGSLALAGGNTIYTEFTDATTYDKIIVTNTNGLTSSASLANPVMVDLRVVNSAAKWTSPGTYTIAQFAGSFVGNANDLFEVTPASQQAGQTYTFSVSGNLLRLTVAGALPSIWNVNASGNWSTAGNWQNGSPNAIGTTAEFSSAITGPQTVTLDAARTVGLIKFNNANAYTVGGSSTLTLNQTTGNAEIQVLSGAHTISAPISLADSLDLNLFNAANSLSLLGNISSSGSMGIAKTGPGSLTLGGNNTFTGGVNFANGTLTFSNNSLGTGTLTLNNATLAWASGNTQDITVGRTVIFGDDPITFFMDDNVTLANDFGSPGIANLTKTGFGTLKIVADASLFGNLTVASGNLTLGNGGATGSIFGNISLPDAASVLTVSRSGDHSINNVISGAGSLVLNGAGIHTLNQPNTFTGPTTINSGTAYLGNSLALQGSTLGYNTIGGSLNFGTNTVATLGGLEGDKNLTLENTDVVPSAVTLTAGANGVSTTYTGILSGPGSFTKAGAGIMTMTGAHTYTGATQVNGGALELSAGVTLNNTTVSVGATGRLTSNGATITASALSNVANAAAGGAQLQLLGGTASYPLGINAVGNSTQGYQILVSSGATLTAGPITLGRSGLNLGTEPTAGSATDGLLVTGGDVDINGTLTLGNASSNSSVSTQITSGTLDVTGAISVGLNNGGRWSVLDVAGGAFSSTDTVTGIRLGGPQQGNAAFLARGGVATVERFQFGNLALGGTSTVHVNGGELYVGSGGMVIGTTEPGFVATLRLSGGTLGAKADWSTSIPVATANTIAVKAADASNVAHNITLSGAITGTGALVKEGGGTLTISGAYSYSGSTAVTAGTLVLKSGTLNDNAGVEVTTGAVLNLDFVGTDTVLGFSIDGTPQASGTWGAIGSGAAHQTARITGTGLLNVPADPFGSWIAGFPAVGAQNGKSDDPDHDGLTNLDEFALDGNPASGLANSKVRVQVETVGAEQALVITLPVRNGATFAGATSKTATVDRIVYTIEGTNTVFLFDQVVTEITASTAGMPAVNTGWTYRTFRLNGAVGGATPRGPKGFLRASLAEQL
ncbi:beta strand repeat-containing protein [Luteolibacter soli]|uniref:Autotransporter-associated beta strand repeat-containing protein n=1 Tax=Luteolibacter soli TaxID=3135280 RepID=A0ABU9ARN7_9BACT